MSKQNEGALSAHHKRLLERSLNQEAFAAYAAKFEKRASHEKWTRFHNEPLPDVINPGELQSIEFDLSQSFFDFKIVTSVRIVLEKGNFAERVTYSEIKEHDSMSSAFAYLSSLSNHYSKGLVL